VSSSPNRKPVVVLLALGVLALVVLAIGIGAGTRDTGGDGGWRDRLASMVSPGRLRVEDLSLRSGSCSVSGSVITFTGGCSYDVAGSGGSLALSDVTKRGRLVVGDHPVRLTLRIEGKDITSDLKPADETTLTFGKDGGALAVVCLSTPLKCTITVTEERR
jgi:hypothetical protein